MVGRARIWTQAYWSLFKAGQSAEQRAQRVDLVVGAQRVVLGYGQAQLTTGGEARGDYGRPCGHGLGEGARPGRLDGPLDQARRHQTGHPKGNAEHAGTGGDLEADVRLAGQGQAPGRAEQGDQVGP